MNTDEHGLKRKFISPAAKKTYANCLTGNAGDGDRGSCAPQELQTFFRRQADLINPCLSVKSVSQKILIKQESIPLYFSLLFRVAPPAQLNLF